MGGEVRSFRVMTYNLFFGGADRVEAIHAVIAHAAPDAVALTEADDPRVVADLAARLGMEHVWAEGSGDRHIAQLTRFPVTAWRVYNRPPLTQAVLETRLEVQPAQFVTLYNVHLLPYLLLPFEIRRAQAMNALLRLIQRYPPGPHLILGDLNAIAPGDRVRQRNNPARVRRVMALQGNIIFRLAIPRLLRAGYVDCYRACHPAKSRPANRERSPAPPEEGRWAQSKEADGFTWHTGNRTTRYDYILADPALAPRLRACRVLDNFPPVEIASDHYPLVADFDL